MRCKGYRHFVRLSCCLSHYVLLTELSCPWLLFLWQRLIKKKFNLQCCVFLIIHQVVYFLLTFFVLWSPHSSWTLSSGKGRAVIRQWARLRWWQASRNLGTRRAAVSCIRSELMEAERRKWQAVLAKLVLLCSLAWLFLSVLVLMEREASGISVTVLSKTIYIAAHAPEQSFCLYKAQTLSCRGFCIQLDLCSFIDACKHFACCGMPQADFPVEVFALGKVYMHAKCWPHTSTSVQILHVYKLHAT